jgi:hypothetical protein
MAAEWDGLFTPLLLFISPLKICGRSWLSTVKWEWQSGSSRPRVSTAEAAASTMHGNQGDHAGFFLLTRGTCGQTLLTAGVCGRWTHYASSPVRVRPFLQRMA